MYGYFLIIVYKTGSRLLSIVFEASPITTMNWWTRTPYSSTNAWNVNNGTNVGQFNNNNATNANGVRPDSVNLKLARYVVLF